MLLATAHCAPRLDEWSDSEPLAALLPREVPHHPVSPPLPHTPNPSSTSTPTPNPSPTPTPTPTQTQTPNRTPTPTPHQVPQAESTEPGASGGGAFGEVLIEWAESLQP